MGKRLLIIFSTLLKYLTLGGAIFYLAVYIFIALTRMTYPYQLEWMEGGAVEHARRILTGQRLYGEPSLAFTPFIYTPFYFYVSAIVSRFTGIGFVPLRFVSFASSIGCFIVIFLFVKRETHCVICSILSVGFFVATFNLSGAWFDIARVDSLFLLLLLASIYVLRGYTSNRDLCIAGILIGLSFLTKQTALVIALPLSIYYFLVSRRWSRIVFFGVFLSVIVTTTLIFDLMSDGWYSYYIFNLPRQHPIENSMIVGFWIYDVLQFVFIACSLAFFYLINLWTKKAYHDALFYIFLAVGMVGTAWLSRMHSGGWNNVLFPAYAVIAIFFGVGIHALKTWRVSKIWQALVNVICIIQFSLLFYNPFVQIPTKADVKAGEMLIRTMKRIQGEILTPGSGYLLALAGKNTYAQRMALDDVLRGKDKNIKNTLQTEIREAILNRQFGAIILDSQWVWFMDEITQEYEPVGYLFYQDDVFWPVTGIQTRPQTLFLPRN